MQGSCNPWPAAKTCASGSPICFSRHFHLSSPWLSNLWIGPPKLGGHVWSFNLPFDLVYILHLNSDVETWNDNLCDSQLLTGSHNFQAHPTCIIFGGVGSVPVGTPTTNTICIIVTLCAIELNFSNLLSFDNCEPWSSSECIMLLRCA